MRIRGGFLTINNVVVALFHPSVTSGGQFKEDGGYCRCVTFLFAFSLNLYLMKMMFRHFYKEGVIPCFCRGIVFHRVCTLPPSFPMC